MNNLSKPVNNECLKEKLRAATMLLSHEHADVRLHAQENTAVLTELLARREAAEKPALCEYGESNGDGTYSVAYGHYPIPTYIKVSTDWPIKLFYAAPPLPVVPDDIRESLYKIATHIAGAKGGMPEGWIDWAEEIETDIRRAAALNHIPDPGNMVNSPVIPDGWISAINRLLDSDGSRGFYSAIRCYDAHQEIESLLEVAPKPPVTENK